MEKENALDLVDSLLSDAKARGADMADAVLFDSVDVAVSQRLGVPEEMERAESRGIGLRVFTGQKSAMASSSDLSKDALSQLCDRVVAMAQASTDDPYAELAGQSLLANVKDGDIKALELYDNISTDLPWWQEQCKQIEDIARSHDGITNSEGASAQLGQSRIVLGTSHGFLQTYQTSSCSLSVSVIAGEGEHMQRDYAYSVARHKDDLKQPQNIGDDAARRTLKRMNPQKLSTQHMPIVFDPRVGKSLLGYFASAISGSAIARGTSFLKNAMGTDIFNQQITIIDDPHHIRGLGSRPFDGEGVANKRLELVTGGTLNSWILDVRSANQLGLQTTGHASRGLTSAPHPASTNLYIEPGTLSPDDMIKDIKHGLYVTEAFGMGVNLITGDYSQGASGFVIENGEITYPVSELTIAGHLSGMYRSLTPANDLVFDYGTNVPTLRIDDMTVAGA